MQSLLNEIKYALLVFAVFLSFMQNGFALEENNKQWIGLTKQGSIGKNSHALYYLFSQLRFIDQAHPWQSVLIEGALGYQVTNDSNAWFGYRWTGRNPYNDFFQENRLIQQVISQKKVSLYRFILRSRLEEITHTNNSEIALRVRERLAVEINHVLFKHALPYFYDEMFFELNRTTYQPQNFIGENRLFLGFNVYQTPTDWWEIGYINQFQVKNPQQTQNQMSHIVSVSYYFS